MNRTTRASHNGTSWRAPEVLELAIQSRAGAPQPIHGLQLSRSLQKCAWVWALPSPGPVGAHSHDHQSSSSSSSSGGARALPQNPVHLSASQLSQLDIAGFRSPVPSVSICVRPCVFVCSPPVSISPPRPERSGDDLDVSVRAGLAFLRPRNGDGETDGCPCDSTEQSARPRRPHHLSSGGSEFVDRRRARGRHLWSRVPLPDRNTGLLLLSRHHQRHVSLADSRSRALVLVRW